MNWLLSRLSEPSTYAGLGTIIAGLVPFFHGGAAATVSTIAQSVSGVAAAPSPMNLALAAVGAVAVIMSEKGKTTGPKP